ncbi:hypothetical protein [Desulfovibrio gilichinskyi]|uniref:Uncharacterized protein n=1 Tax=Desulfovibrio gilichinskyi TaxID=1519643 RepID=A0A1X7ERT2_9BACT|nr:hypothetical protein [Desulfovibrio gilichinskyi]SMF38690.1 hypothetical protein SAMN06295933_3256 [Desulfovibrio gilichinskyi]
MTQNKKIKSKNKFASLIERLFIILFGAGIMMAANPLDPNWHTSFKGFSLNIFARWGVAFIGFIFIFYSFFLYQIVKKRSAKQAPWICPMCQTVYLSGPLQNGKICSKCNFKLEQLKGFYERHPEMKDTKEEWSDTNPD